MKQPRFQVVAVAGGELHLYARYLRKTELEQIAKDLGADIPTWSLCLNLNKNEEGSWQFLSARAAS